MASGIVASGAMSTLSTRNNRPARLGRTHPAQRLQLTRRGRLVLLGAPLILLTVLALVLIGFVTSPLKAGVDAGGADAVQVTVQAGESIWSIAAHSGVNRDPRDVVAEIVQLNGLENSVVHPGQQIFVPKG